MASAPAPARLTRALTADDVALVASRTGSAKMDDIKRYCAENQIHAEHYGLLALLLNQNYKKTGAPASLTQPQADAAVACAPHWLLGAAGVTSTLEGAEQFNGTCTHTHTHPRAPVRSAGPGLGSARLRPPSRAPRQARRAVRGQPVRAPPEAPPAILAYKSKYLDLEGS